MIKFVNYFTKITAYIPQKIVFNTKIYYENKAVQGRKIKGKAIVICNHTSIFDYACLLFVFFFRTVRYQMAEVLFKKKVLGTFLKLLGGIYVDRDARNFSFVSKSCEILEKGGAVGAFPESRLPRKGEKRPLEFKTSTAYIALCTNTQIIPVFTNGKYFTTKRARVIIGTPIYPEEVADDSLTEKENIEKLNLVMREKIIYLEKLLNEKSGEKTE